MQFTKEQLQAAYKKLPPEIQSIIGSEERSDSYQEIMRSFNLTVGDITKISEEAAPVICGLVHPRDFSTNLRKILPQIPEDTFQNLVKKIDENLFAPIRHDILEKSHKTIAAQPQPMQEISRVMPNDIAKTKLEQSFRIPPQTTTVTLPQTPSQNRPQSGFDPYREPIQ